jgi:hypothetical protein
MAHHLRHVFGSSRSDERAWPFTTQQRRMARAPIGAVAVGSSAVGATAIGALAFGAVAIGALAIRKLAVKQARVQRLEIGELVVDRLVVREGKGLSREAQTNGHDEEPDLFDEAPRRNGSMEPQRRAHRTASALKPGDDAPPGTPGTAENICPDCNGSGLINDTTCENCDGTGKVVQGLAGG